MHTLIFLNGDPPSRKVVNNYLKKSNYIIAADGGANHLRATDICPDLIIGDLDSVNKETLSYYKKRSIIKKIRDQNFTDLEKSLLFCLKEKKENLIIFGISGNRIDHTLNNFSILRRYYKKIDIKIISGEYEILFIKNKIDFFYRKGEIVSLLALPKASGISSKGLKYPLKDSKLEFGLKEGALNESTSSSIYIEFKSGNLLLFKKHFVE